MWGLKRAAALLLPTLTNSLVLPPNHQLQRPIDHLLTEDPALRVPFIYEYQVRNQASIQFSLRPDEEDVAVDQSDNELISVVVRPSEGVGCSDDFDTHILVNGESLVASHQKIVDGQVVQRSGTSSFALGTRQTALRDDGFSNSWTLQCVCTDVISSLLSSAGSKCENIGYILNFQRASAPSPNAEGFTLSFTQNTHPKLLRLTSLALSTIDASKSLAQELAYSRHWLAPLLHPIDSLISQVPISTLTQTLPKFSATSIQSFHTVTKPTKPAATHAHAAALSSRADVSISATPSVTSEEHALPTSLIQHDELDDERLQSYDFIDDQSRQEQSDQSSEDRISILLLGDELSASDDTSGTLRQFFVGAGMQAQKTFHAVIAHLANAHASAMQVHADAVRNETREFHDALHYNATVSHLPEMPDVSFQHVFVVSLGIFAAVGGTICACIRYRDPRRRAERAARREEKANLRAYRKAAFRHRFNKFLDRLKGRETYQTQSQTYARAQMHMRNPSRESDLEWHDKDQSTTAVPSDASGVRKGIGELREAHGFVEGILRATSGMYRNSRKRDSSRGSRSRRFSDAASEKSALPPYTAEDDCEDQIVVVDGLHFTVRRRREATPGSSIIDTSPRESDCGSSDGEKE